MTLCSHCRRPLTLPPKGNTVACPSCWRTNFVTKETLPAELPLLSEAAASSGATPADALDAFFEEILGAIRGTARWTGLLLWQALLLTAAWWTCRHPGLALEAKILSRFPDPAPQELYLRWLPHVLGAIAYLALLEASLLLSDWFARVRRSGQGVPTVALMVWHGAVLRLWRAVTVALAGVAGGSLGYALFQALPREGPAGPGFGGLLVFMVVGFTRCSLLLYASLFVGALAGVAECLQHAPAAAQTAVNLGFTVVRVAPADGLVPALAILLASGFFLYAEMLASRKYGFCGRCSAYVRQDRDGCPRCPVRRDGRAGR